jgi:putative lysine transport system permease protein
MILLQENYFTSFPFYLVAYIEIFRGTPMIVQAMVIYYGLPNCGLDMSPMVAALFFVSINTGAYMAEIAEAEYIVDKGQYEAAQSIE